MGFDLQLPFCQIGACNAKNHGSAAFCLRAQCCLGQQIRNVCHRRRRERDNGTPAGVQQLELLGEDRTPAGLLLGGHGPPSQRCCPVKTAGTAKEDEKSRRGGGGVLVWLCNVYDGLR